MDVQAHAIVRCPRCATSFEPSQRITDPKVFEAFADRVGMLNCPRCHGHVPLNDNTMRFALTGIPM